MALPTQGFAARKGPETDLQMPPLTVVQDVLEDAASSNDMKTCKEHNRNFDVNRFGSLCLNYKCLKGVKVVEVLRNNSSEEHSSQ